MFAVCFRKLPAVLQFQSGAEQLITLAQSHPHLLEKLFVGGVPPLTFCTLRQLYTVDYADPGSNNRREEEETVFAWECCLQKCEGLNTC